MNTEKVVEAEATVDETNVSSEHFSKVDIRAGKITEASVVNKSVKLLKLTVDFGEQIGTRQVVSGIRESYLPHKLIGRTAQFVINLVPRKIMGIESHGMILALNVVDNVVLVPFLSESVQPGTRIG
jgi:methionyl-tRNA synthetase